MVLLLLSFHNNSEIRETDNYATRQITSLLLSSYTVDRQLRHSTDHVLTAEQLHSRQTTTTLDRSRPYY
jgi:hypothetical protein